MRLVIVLLTLALGIGVASADDVPWADGVPADKQARAKALFSEGNQLFARQAHAAALEKYEAAIVLWDHPLIRFNMAVTRIRLDQIIEADQDMERALRFGAQPFAPDDHRQALDYRSLLAGRIAELRARCDQRGVRVLLDGKQWFSCPGSQQRRVLAGEHVVVAEHAGYHTLSRHLVMAGGAKKNLDLELEPTGHWYQKWYVWTAAVLLTGATVATVIYVTRDEGNDVPFTAMPGLVAW